MALIAASRASDLMRILLWPSPSTLPFTTG